MKDLSVTSNAAEFYLQEASSPLEKRQSCSRQYKTQESRILYVWKLFLETGMAKEMTNTNNRSAPPQDTEWGNPER